MRSRGRRRDRRVVSLRLLLQQVYRVLAQSLPALCARAVVHLGDAVSELLDLRVELSLPLRAGVRRALILYQNQGLVGRTEGPCQLQVLSSGQHLAFTR